MAQISQSFQIFMNLIEYRKEVEMGGGGGGRGGGVLRGSLSWCNMYHQRSYSHIDVTLHTSDLLCT